ncbi:unnamed protein product [Durusdinium trenchii]|uniref:Cyclic nucleotide-binding domain-containing protein n=1 Tax=Durusdinium trenchii TaxID=1381693 RepID=A0ABP0KZ62_9DINO
MTENWSEDVVSLVSSALAAQRIFKGCDPDLLKRLAAQAFSWTPGRGHEIPMKDEMSLMIVVSGALYVCVGGHAASLASGGFALGFVGMLRLHEAAQVQFRTYLRTLRRRSKIAGKPKPSRPNSVIVDVTQILPNEEDPSHLPNPDASGEDFGFTLPDLSDGTQQLVRDCLMNLCPHTSSVSSSSEQSTVPLRMEVVDALTNQRNLLQKEDTQAGKCKLACISLERIHDVFAGTPSLEIFDENQQAVRYRFETLIRLATFPNLPLEVIWMLASVSELRNYAAGDPVVQEGDCDSVESLLVLSKGSADVSKILFDGKLLEAQPFKIARLYPGAMIGDVFFIESWISRQASVIAHEDAEVIELPSRSLLEVMACYPGLASIYVSRSREASAILQRSLTRPTDVLAGMKLFYGLNPAFILSVANITDRKMNFLGDVFKEEGSTDRTLRVQEFGKVRVETKREGTVALSDVGTVLGETMFLGMRSVSQATFRAATPLLVMLWIPHHSFESIIDDGYPSEGAYFRSLQRTDQGREDMSHYAHDMKLFRGCGQSVIQDIGKCIHRQAYKPGQTIVVQAAIDDRSLFLVTTGKAKVFVNGKVQPEEELLPGDVFGQLALLGLVLLRSATVVASTYCSCFKLPRQAFLDALEKHPEETDLFEQLTRLHAVQVAAEQGTWPFLTQDPSRFVHPSQESERLLYYWNLHANRRSTPPGAWVTREGALLPTDVAYLLVSGEVYVTEESGHRSLMTPGSCFGEHVLIGLAAGIASIEPKTACEVQLIGRAEFEKVMSECPDERDSTVQGILDEMAIKAQQKLGVERGSPHILNRCAFFRAVHEDFMKLMRPRMKAMLFKAGDFITRERDYADRMFIVLRGSAVVVGEGEAPALCFRAGAAISEASLLGTCTFYPYAVRAEDLCLVLSLLRNDFNEVLEQFPAEREVFRQLFADEEDILRRLPRVLKLHHPLFASSSIDFLKAVCEFADEVYYAAGECIIVCGESCSVGETVMYMLVAGNAAVILAHGEEVAQIKSGSLVGEGGALGIAAKRSTQVSAWKGGMVRLIRLQGQSIGKAVQKHPDDCKALEMQFQSRSQKNAEAEAIRREWIGKTVMPMLKNCQIFQDFSTKLIAKIAAPLLKISFAKGQNLCVAGDAAESLMVIIDGEVEAKSKEGKPVARLMTSAVTGELAILGLLSFRTVTLTACRPTDTVVVTSAGLRPILKSSEAASQHLQKLAQEKLSQIDRGFPILSLPLGASNDVVVRTIALHSARCIWAPGETWRIPENATASGRHHWIFARGRAVVLVGPADHPMNPIQTVGTGAMAILPEWLCMQYEARAVALTPVEAFRISCMDIQLATLSVRSIPSWFQRFRGLEREAIENFAAKLFRAKAVIDMNRPKVPILKPLKKFRSASKLKTTGPIKMQVEEEPDTPVFSASTKSSPFGPSETSMKRPSSQAGLLSTYPTRDATHNDGRGHLRLRPLSANRRKPSKQC